MSKAYERRIKKIFDEYTEGKLKGEKVSIQGLMEKYGYSIKSASVCSVTQTQKWQQLLDSIDDEPFLKKLRQIALDATKDSDAINAIDKLMKLKKRYPEQQTNPRNVFQTQINNLLTDDSDDEYIEVNEDKQISGA